MSKSKKHSPIQTETEPSIISQIPREHMKTAIEELVAIAQARKAKQASELSREEQYQRLDTETQEDPSLAALHGSKPTAAGPSEKEEE